MATPSTLASGRSLTPVYGLTPLPSTTENWSTGRCQPLVPAKQRSLSLQKLGLRVPIPIHVPGSWRFRMGVSPLLAQRQRVQAVGTLVKESSSVNAEAVATDAFVVSLVQTLVESSGPATSALTELREKSILSAKSMRWPGNKDEAYRFTDLKSLRAANIISSLPSSDLQVDLSSYTLEEANETRVVIAEGVVCPLLSVLEGLPAGVAVASLSQLPEDIITMVAPHLGNEVNYGAAGLDLFSCLNGAGVQDILVIYVPQGVRVEKPIHIVYASKGPEKKGADESTPVQMSHPRILVVLEEDAHAVIVEEFVGLEGDSYWTNAVSEFVLGEAAHLMHGYIQSQARTSYHIKKTVVAQAATSAYSLVEAEMGGRLTRHNLHVEQGGAETETELSSFLLAGHSQLHDLHSSIGLHHPRGKTRQLHKCIVTHSTGHGVFDGNVKVNRFAQETDAGQLSRNLLLAPRATVNVKPNLQIIADAVKCTHGATISDLEEEQMFYFRARGIDMQTARSALVFSFGAEVIERLPYEGLRQRIEGTVKGALAAEGAMDPSVAAAVGSSA